MTVYYQFKSKGKLLEALFDDFAKRADMHEMRRAFQESDPLKSLDAIIGVFCRLWESQGALLRRLTTLAALDPEVNDALSERGSWRKEALTEIVRRLPDKKDQEEIVDVLFALTSVEAFDTLAVRHKSSKNIAKVLFRAAAAICGSF